MKVAFRRIRKIRKRSLALGLCLAMVLTLMPAVSIPALADTSGGGIVTIADSGDGLNAPSGIAVTTTGDTIYVADTGNNAIKRMNADGSNIVTFGSGFSAPHGVAVDSDGKIYVADTGNNAIKRMDADGSNIVILGSGFSAPYGVAVDDNDGKVYVADTGNNAIKKMDADGSDLSTINTYDYITSPKGIAVNDGTIRLTDVAGDRNRLYNINIAVGSVGYTSVEINLASGLAIGADGSIFIADTGNNAVKRYDGELFTISSQFNAPGGVAVDADGNIYVTDTGNNAIKKIQPCILSYSANGGTGTAPSAVTAYPGRTLEVAENTFTAPLGMGFAAWNTVADGSGTSYDPGDETIMPDNNLTLYAIWGPYQDGTEEHPIRINDYTDLRKMGDEDYYDKHFLQTQDIVFPAGYYWEPPEVFAGVYDGSGHSITNMKAYYSFIYCLQGEDAALKNLTLVNPVVTGEGCAGALVAYNVNGTIQNCHVSGGVISGVGESFVGALAGINDGTVSNCSASDVVVIGGDGSGVGGLVGSNDETGTVENCSVSGIIGGGGEADVGLVERYGDRVTNCTTVGAFILPFSTTAQLCFDFEDGTFSIDETEVTGLTGWSYEDGALTLNGFKHYTLAPYGLYLAGNVDGKGTIILAPGSTNTICSLFYSDKKNNDTYGIGYKNAASLTIDGTGTLNVQSGESEKSESAGIYTPYGLDVLGGTINASSDYGKFTYGINTRRLDMSGGTVNASGYGAKSSSYGIFAINDITISAGTVNAVSGYTDTGGGAGLDDGIGISAAIGTESGNITISGGNITAESGDGTNLSTGIGASAGYDINNPEENCGAVTITAGTVTATAGESEIISGGITAFDDIVISGGTVTATGQTKALFALGTATVSSSEYTYQTNPAATSSGATMGYSTQALFDNTAGTYKYVRIAPYTKLSAAIGGVTAPARGAVPVSAIETAQYTGTVTWEPADSNFKASTVYTATITLTPKMGYTLTGVAADSFTVAGATSAANEANSGVITAVFPATGSGGSSSSASPPPATPAAPGGTIAAPAPALNQSTGVAATQISSTALNAALASAVQDSAGKKTVEITVPPVQGASGYETSLPASALSSGTDTQVAINTAVANVTLPGNMLSGTGITGDAGLTIGTGDKSNLPDDVKAAIGDRPLIQLSLSVDGKQTDWNNPDAPVTVSVPYTPTAEELANPESVVVWYIDGKGNVVSVPNGRYDPATGTVIMDVTHFSDYAVVYNQVRFNDVTAGAWYYKPVSFIAAREITTGTGDGNFSPEARLTRGQFLVMLMKAYGIEPDVNGAANFVDAGSTYYTGYLAAAKRLGISGGVGDNLFAPEKEITRQEMFTLLYNGLKTVGQLPQGDVGKKLSGFSDAGQVASWAQEAMALLVKTGTVSGSAGKLTPLSTTTRAEMAQVLYNLLSK
ncbi:MAG TPA: S-layer homology domain-containing protein [Negativicutes bacterium]|nr:S-layer homology domain-containing protein [Negativicutes bacterium]